jgi:hypothetical protein
MSRDSTLNFEGYYYILRYSAVTQFAWGQILDPPDDEYGYGRVDAFRAILSISRGDINNDNSIGDILDLNFLVNYILRGGPEPFPTILLGDCNCDGLGSNILDLNYLVNYIFRGSELPPVNPCYEF